METETDLTGRVALVTGASRRRGIGWATAARLADLGASVLIHRFSPHDAEQPWGADDAETTAAALRPHLRGSTRLECWDGDLAEPDAPDQLMTHAVEQFGHVDVLVCNHARSGADGDLGEMTAELVDAHWQVNARSTLLLTSAFARQHDGRAGGRVVWLTSGQVEGPMPQEIAYATSKAALAGITPSVAAWLVERGIGLNTVNPGPVNTGYLDQETRDRPSEELAAVLERFPGGRFGEPADAARLIAWLATDDAHWVIGQVISSEGGFRRG